MKQKTEQIIFKFSREKCSFSSVSRARANRKELHTHIYKYLFAKPGVPRSVCVCDCVCVVQLLGSLNFCRPGAAVKAKAKVFV